MWDKRLATMVGVRTTVEPKHKQTPRHSKCSIESLLLNVTKKTTFLQIFSYFEKVHHNNYGQTAIT
jgi:hypothetical protein